MPQFRPRNTLPTCSKERSRIPTRLTSASWHWDAIIWSVYFSSYCSPPRDDENERATDDLDELSDVEDGYATDDSTFMAWSLERVVDVVRTKTDADWIELFWDRYLNFAKLERRLGTWGRWN